MRKFRTLFLVLAVISSLSFTTGWYGYQQSCPDIYLRYSRQHTACRPPNPYCNIYSRGISKRDQEVIVRKHNLLRNFVALGYERTNNQPAAANMMQMVWDNELADVAQKHADLCIFAHDCNECRSVEAFSVGQNIAMKARTGNTLPVPDWDATIESLYEEVKYFRPRWINPFRAPKRPMTGHYSQIVWADSWKVGCGYTIHSYSKDRRFKFVELYTCNYGPMGNVRMREMYRIGRPCSQCPKNTCCGRGCERLGISAEYEGLCKAMDSSGPQPSMPKGNIFLWCNFRADHRNSDWCDFIIDGARNWKTRKVATGTYATIVLTGGQKTALRFKTEMNLPQYLCIHLEYRKGPAIAGDFSRNSLSGILQSTVSDAYYYLNFTSDANDWVVTELPIRWWGGPSLMTILFSVPYRAPAQYLDLKELYMREGRCLS